MAPPRISPVCLCGLILLLAVVSNIAAAAPPADSPAASKPNIVLIFTDDQGYGDIGCFGAQDIRTPRIDQLAKEGMRFTDFYVAQAVCTASRAALMTGCYPNRVSLYGALNHTSPTGINPTERLLPEMLQDEGYATAIFGKWHLGLQPMFHPQQHGFDDYLGIPYSNDNSKYHPIVRDMPPLPLFDGAAIVERDPDQSQFTRRFTDRAIDFIAKHKDRPFFVYIPHVMPHVPIFASEKFRGQSRRGLYGDVVEELDHSVGRILETLDELKLADKTLVIFMSDNGPFLSYGAHAGSAGKLREGKLTTYEGGMRTPCLMRWPGVIPAGKTCGELATTMDLLPTLAKLTGGKLSDNRIDGRDIEPLLRGDADAKTPHEAFYYYAGSELQALRSGTWKLHFAHPYLTVAGEPGKNGKPSNWEHLTPDSITQSGLEGIASRHGYRVAQQPQALYDLRTDPGETRDVAAEHPEVVARLEALAEAARRDLGDRLTQRTGEHVRPAGRVASE